MDLTPWSPAREQAAAVVRGRVSSRELVEQMLTRIERSDLNAVVTVDADAARAAADRCDAAVSAGSALPPLHGVPITVKDAWAVRGMRSTSGLPELRADVPAYDAVAVARLREAGAVIVGKTNVPPGITGQETANCLFGRTLNPWDRRRTPGGSSGGAAAALAAGLTPLELGSDSGGSIRQPAHCCGVFGHVPTHGVVPLRGHRPQVPWEHVGKDVDLMTAGPLARSAGDLALALDVLAGDDPAIGGGMRFDLPPARVTALRGARIGVWLDDPFCPTDALVLDRLRAVADAVADRGAVVSERRPPVSLAEAWDVAFPLWVAASSARTSEEELHRLRGQRDADGLAGQRARAETMTHADWLRLDEQRHELQRRWASVFDDVDVLLCPVIPVVAPEHDPVDDLDEIASVDHRLARTIRVNGADRPYLDQLTWNIVVGLAGLPATVAPAGLSAAGLPVGVQILGDRYADRTTIRTAELLETEVAGFVVPPAA
ncbi:MAG TPA: amidase [Mycobacteriales bacterium]|nr:amidase [Mycobacteriales bacterium]